MIVLSLNSVPYHENYNYVDNKIHSLRNKTHYYIDKITKTLDCFQYNVSVALIREYSNVIFSFNKEKNDKEEQIALKFSLTNGLFLFLPWFLT